MGNPQPSEPSEPSEPFDSSEPFEPFLRTFLHNPSTQPAGPAGPPPFGADAPPSPRKRWDNKWGNPLNPQRQRRCPMAATTTLGAKPRQPSLQRGRLQASPLQFPPVWYMMDANKNKRWYLWN